MNQEKKETISNDELLQKLFDCTQFVPADMAFYLGAACGRIHAQEKMIEELRAELESMDIQMEDNS